MIYDRILEHLDNESWWATEERRDSVRIFCRRCGRLKSVICGRSSLVIDHWPGGPKDVREERLPGESAALFSAAACRKINHSGGCPCARGGALSGIGSIRVPRTVRPPKAARTHQVPKSDEP